MLTIRVNQDTFLKKSTDPSETLAATQKVFVGAESEYKVKSYFKQGRHYFVKLAEEIMHLGKSGFFFEDHIQIEEIRGVWITNVDSNFLTSDKSIQEEIEKLKELKFNTIYPVVWNRGYTLYPSPVAKKYIGLEVAEEFKDRDILAEIIKAANGHFRVIPWFEYGLMTPSGSPLEVNKPEWITHTATGDKVKDGNCWLNSCHPDVQQFMAELIADVVERYEVDGVQVDDHFGMPATMGFDAFTKKLYKVETGGADPSSNPNSQNWKRWRMNKVTSLLKQIFAAVKSKKEDCIISVSPNPLNFSKENALADWQAWEQEGIVEELVLQVYRRSLASFKGEIDKSEIKASSTHIPTVIGILTGLKPDDSRVSLDSIAEQVEATRQRDFAGYSFFFSGSLFDLGLAEDTPTNRENAFASLLSTDQFV